MDFWRGDYGLHNSVYSSIGAWRGGNYFNATLDCSPSNPPSPNNYCIGWRQTINDCLTPNEGNYANGGNLTWSPLTAPSSGNSWCITAWVREKGTKPDGSFGCLDSTSIYPGTGLLPLWNSGHRIDTLTYTITPDLSTGGLFIDYYVKLSGNAFVDEYAELRKGFSSGFCGPIKIGPGVDFTCRKAISAGEDINDYIGSDLCVVVADTRNSNNCLVPAPAPISCSASFNPLSGTVTQGDIFNLQGKIKTISGGNGSGYDYMWARRYGPGNYLYPPTINPDRTGVWYPGRWNSAGLAPGTYYLVFLAKNKNLSWNYAVECSGQSAVAVIDAPWFQAKGGDIQSSGGITSWLPASEQFSLNLDNFPGTVSFYSTNPSYEPNFGSGTVSTRGWLANSLFGPLFSYDSLYRKLDQPTVDNFSCEPGCPIPPSWKTTIYYSVDKVAIRSSWLIPSNTKVIVLINRELEINKNVTVPVGSFLAFIVKGNINISGDVGSKTVGPFTGTNAHLQGIYITDGFIDTYFDKGVGLGSGKRLVAGGVFYAKQGFNLKRDLKNETIPPATINNETAPAELFIFRPDLVVNAPIELLFSPISWQEVAP